MRLAQHYLAVPALATDKHDLTHLAHLRGCHLVQHCPNDLRITLAPIQPSVPQAGRYRNRHPVVEASHQAVRTAGDDDTGAQPFSRLGIRPRGPQPSERQR